MKTIIKTTTPGIIVLISAGVGAGVVLEGSVGVTLGDNFGPVVALVLGVVFAIAFGLLDRRLVMAAQRRALKARRPIRMGARTEVPEETR